MVESWRSLFAPSTERYLKNLVVDIAGEEVQNFVPN
jgi:hypothetical protein